MPLICPTANREKGKDLKAIVFAAGLGLLALQGCATKNYGRQGTLTDYEKQTMTCREIDLERAKVKGFLDHVDKESEFDGRSVLSFLGDFGIGNTIEKENAVNSADERDYQLQQAAFQKGCTTEAPKRADRPQPHPPVPGAASLDKRPF